MAVWADYIAVRDLVLDAVSHGLGATVPPTVRETVEVVTDLKHEHTEGVPAAALARKLGIDKSAARRRLLAAASAGYVVNQEERRGRPGRYVIGEPLPGDHPVLPGPPRHPEGDEPAGQANGGTVARGSEGIETGAEANLRRTR